MTEGKRALLNAAVVSHVFATGPAHELVDYLRSRVWAVQFIRHPFGYAVEKRSSYDLIQNGKLVSHMDATAWNLPEVFMFAKDLVYTLMWILQSNRCVELYVGADPLNCLAGLILRRLGRVGRVVFYTIDYVPRRFQNPILNRLYRTLDVYCASNADLTWNLSPRISEARGKHLRPGQRIGKEMTVPIGIWIDRIKPLSIEDVPRNKLAFVGHLRRGQGAELMVRSMTRIIEKVPDASLMIIGTGPLEEELRRIVSRLKLDGHVVFEGFIENHERIEHLVSSCGIGMALYEPGPDNFTVYTDPGKPKLYLACGLPVIITNVPWIAKEIEGVSMGIVVPFDEQEVANGAIKLMTDSVYYDSSRRNALEYAQQIDWNQIFQSALQGII